MLGEHRVVIARNTRCRKNEPCRSSWPTILCRTNSDVLFVSPSRRERGCTSHLGLLTKSLTSMKHSVAETEEMG